MAYNITVDFWENQRFKPLQGGWASPFYGGFPNYSDLVGQDVAKGSCLNDDSLYLPSGWAWLDEWKVDSSGYFGEADEQGWSYAASFDSLVKASQDRLLRKERGALLVTRRRRWIRVAKCVDAKAIEREAERTVRLQWLISECRSRSKILETVDQELVTAYFLWDGGIEAVKCAAQRALVLLERRLKDLAKQL
eukprot:gene37425-45446_t